MPKDLVRSIYSKKLVASIEENMIEYYFHYRYSSICEIHEEPHLIKFSTGVDFPLFNGIFKTNVSTNNVNDVIMKTVNYIRSKKLPFFWWTSPLTNPKDLGKYLEVHGFMFVGKIPVMAIDLSNLQNVFGIPNFTIKEVKNKTALTDWIRIVTRGSELPERMSNQITELELNPKVIQNNSIRRYIGFFNGIPVASSAMLLHSGIAGIYVVATLPEFRNRGIGSTMVLSSLYDAKKRGYQVGALQSSPKGYVVYHRLGFRTVCEFGLYLWK